MTHNSLNMAALIKARFMSGSAFKPFLRKCKGLTLNGHGMARSVHNGDNSTDDNYDVIITGGGMVGTTLALALANNRKLENAKILLLEGGPERKYKPQEKFSNRVVALNQQTRILLSSIGAWKHIENVRYASVRKMQVWDACSDAMITFNEDLLLDDLAYVVENDVLLHAVTTQVAEKPSVRVIYGAQVNDICLAEGSKEHSEVKLKNGERFKTQMLIGADGANSRIRQAMGVQYVNWSYDQMGVVATLELSEATENVVAWQRFLPGGPIALLPLTSSLSSLVWSVSKSEATRLLSMPVEEFIDNLNGALWKVYPKDGMVESGMKALQQLLENFNLQTGVSRQLQPSIQNIVEGSRAAFPLAFGHAVNYVQPGVALVGDAAHRVHPLAGQGVNLGFGDINVLVQILAECVYNGSYLGDPSYLKKYETVRQRHNVPTMLTIDTLHRLYKGTAAPIVLARSIGLQLTNAFPPLKKMIMQHAADRECIQKC